MKLTSSKHLFLCMALSLTTLCVDAQLPVEKSLLWKITGKNLKDTSYLFGTYHVICSNDGIIPVKLQRILSAASPRMGFLPQGHFLNDYIPIDIYNKVSKVYLEKTHFTFELNAFYYPLLTLTELYPYLMGCPTTVSLDDEILRSAQSKSLPIFGLESRDTSSKVWEQQIPIQAQADIVVKTLLNWDEYVKTVAQNVAWYRSQDIEAFTHDIHYGDFKDYAQYLLDNRNHRWIPEIEKAVTNGRVLFAVGAAHLAGENGLINLLRRDGFTLTPMMNIYSN
jgi:uncharacterized protein YbaP (TraB family)